MGCKGWGGQDRGACNTFKRVFVGAAERLLVCFCVVVWVFFSVFSIFSITSFGDYTHLQYQETTL